MVVQHKSASGSVWIRFVLKSTSPRGEVTDILASNSNLFSEAQKTWRFGREKRPMGSSFIMLWSIVKLFLIHMLWSKLWDKKQDHKKGHKQFQMSPTMKRKEGVVNWFKGGDCVIALVKDLKSLKCWKAFRNSRQHAPTEWNLHELRLSLQKWANIWQGCTLQNQASLIVHHNQVLFCVHITRCSSQCESISVSNKVHANAHSSLFSFWDWKRNPLFFLLFLTECLFFLSSFLLPFTTFSHW